MRWATIRKKLAKVDRALDKAMAASEIPGAVVLARMPREGEVLDHLSVRGHAVQRPERIAMSRETRFDLASLTKVMVSATGILLLADEGQLDLDDPVAKHLPQFGERDKEAVTIRHLLTHSSGLKPWRDFHEPLLEREQKKGERLMGTPAGHEWVCNAIYRSALVHEPGTAAVYGDLDFIVLGEVISALSHQPLEVFAEERIFEPLGLENTGYRSLPEEGAPPDPAARSIAATENCPWRGRVLWGEVHDPNAWVMGGVAGHAGLFSTADDVMRFASAWLDAWHGRESPLPAERVREFAERQRLPEESDWALGWDTPTAGSSSSGTHFSEKSIGHLGFTGTSVWIDLETEAIVVMLTNRIHQVVKRSRFGLRPIVHDAIREAFVA
ncbi:MAG: serine hydrolase domain-containing protein [Myxococcota bacterium]